jgi:hypothetical protein
MILLFCELFMNGFEITIRILAFVATVPKIPVFVDLATYVGIFVHRLCTLHVHLCYSPWRRINDNGHR